MAKHDSLFELVQSLNQSEKRYLRIFASRHVKGGENQYMKIFSVFDKMATYDDQELKKGLEREGVTGSIARNKTYLKNLILKSLVAYHSDSSTRNRIKDLLRTVEVLYQKSLGEQCRTQLEKAEKLARENDELLLLLEINQWKTKVMRITSLPEDPAAYIGALRAERATLIHAYDNFADYNALSVHLALLNTAGGGTRSAEEVRQRQAVVDSPLLTDPDQALSDSARMIFYSLKGAIHIQAFEYAAAARHLESSLRLMETRPSIIRDRPFIYVHVLRNLIWVTRWMDDPPLTRRWIEHLETASPEWLGSKVREANVQEYFANLLSLLDYYKDTGDSALGKQAMEAFAPHIDRYKSLLRDAQLIAYHFMAGVIHFEEEDYRQAVKYFTKVIHFPNIDLREDLHCMTRVLLLLSHLELGNTDLLEYLVKSATRFLEKKQRLYQMETALLGFIRRDLLAAYGTQDWKPALQRFRAELEEIAALPFERKALKYFNFLAYFEARVQGREMKAVLRELENAPKA